jgi:uncharacterized membrane protein
MGLVFLGSFLPWGGPALWTWGPLAVAPVALLPMALGFLGLMQVTSATSTKVGNIVMLGLAVIGATAAVAASAGDKLLTHGPWGLGMGVVLVGALADLASIELQRREGDLSYRAMALRAVELALTPRVHIALLKLLIPFALVGAFVFAVLQLAGTDTAASLGVIFGLYFINPAGKETAIPVALADKSTKVAGIQGLGLDPVLTFAFIVLVDACTALFFVWNYDYAIRLPYLGRLLAWVERRGHATVEKHKWIRRLAFFGLVIYAALPLEGTGAVGGSVVGRAIGLTSLRTFAAVVTGSVLRTTVTILIFAGLLAALHL